MFNQRCLLSIYTQILLACDLEYIKKEQEQKILEDIKEVERILMALINSLENKHLNL